MTYTKALAIIGIWMAPAIAIIFTNESILGWVFLGSVVATEEIATWKEVERKNTDSEEVINITKKFNELEFSSQECADRFKSLLDEYVFCNENELTDGAKKLRQKLKKFCIDNFNR